MKKFIILLISLAFIYYLYNYLSHDYEIKYNISAYEILEKYENGRYYFEIKVDGNIYNFDLYKTKLFSKKLIKEVKDVSGDNYYCIYPVIKGSDTYPLCSYGNEKISYNLIDEKTINDFVSKLNIKYEKQTYVNEKIYYYDNLDRNTYIALYAYDGYYILNNKEMEYIKLFNKEEYSNDYAYQFNKYIISPSYDEKYEFNTIKMLDMVTKSIYDIKSINNISYDFYYVGYVKNNVYLFDKKFNKLYEINTIKKTIEEIGNEDIGFIKYVNGSKENARINDYRIHNIKYNEVKKSNYTYDLYDGVYKIINDNKNIKTKIIDIRSVNIIKEYNNILYYTDEDKFYQYSPCNGNKLVFNNYELKFNKTNNIFIYNR